MGRAAPLFAELADGPKEGAAFWLHASDGVRLRVGLFPAQDAKGTVFLFPGRTEYVEKYGRTAADLVARGFSVMVVDWRGQGLADRLLDDQRTGHVADFMDYQRDVDAVWDMARAADLPQPWHLMAHSMGGCIGLRSLQRGLPFASVVFSGPMWGIKISSLIRPAAWALSWGGTRTGLGHLFVPGTKPQSYVASEPFEDNSLTTDPEMFDYMRRQVVSEPALQLGGPSLQWLSAALAECRALSQMSTPGLPCVTFCGDRERIVDIDVMRRMMVRWTGGRFELVSNAEHEVLMGNRALRNHVADTAASLFHSASGHSGQDALSA